MRKMINYLPLAASLVFCVAAFSCSDAATGFGLFMFSLACLVLDGLMTLWRIAELEQDQSRQRSHRGGKSDDTIRISSSDIIFAEGDKFKNKPVEMKQDPK